MTTTATVGIAIASFVIGGIAGYVAGGIMQFKLSY